jgi:medium-chain acyl-[acyl-carrier-protein] hydrolase
MQGKFIGNGHLLRKNDSRAGIRLFCFPYAGGGAYIFRPWGRILKSSVEVCPIQLPGRESRMQEAPSADLLALVRDIAKEIHNYLDKPFAFFGHSMGALLGFELTRYLRDQHGIEPLKLFVSGRRAPHLSRTEPPIFNLPDQALVAELRRLNGTPEQVLKDGDLLSMMLPVVRADLAMVECYRYAPGEPIGCPIAAFGGLDDQEVRREHLESWRMHTTSQFSLQMFEGNHFFIKTSDSVFLEQLGIQLRELLPSRSLPSA